jgi:hypothetical protein
MNNKSKVLNYIKDLDKSPLKFNFSSIADQRRGEKNINAVINDWFVWTILESTGKYGSINSLTKIKETYAGCNRSVLDIWRHCIYYRPELTIFDIMNSLYSLVYDGDISTLFCGNIERRVFYIYFSYNEEDDDFSGEFDGYQDSSDEEEEDEFGLVFPEWCGIN